MSSRRGERSGGEKGKNVVPQSSAVEELARAVGDVGLQAPQDEGDWEVITKKSRSRGGSSVAKPWGGQQNPSPRPSGGADGGGGQKFGRGNGGAPGNAWHSLGGRGRGNGQAVKEIMEYNHPTVQHQTVIKPPLQHGWNWQSRVGGLPQGNNEFEVKQEEDNEVDDEGEEDDDDEVIDDSDDELLSDEFDSDTSQQSHETRKMNRWFKKFFDTLDSLSLEQINDPARQWHCPACQNGPGAIDWYTGLQPLWTHAKTKGAKRVKLHRELAQLLDEELHRRGTSVIPAGEMFGKWKGLQVEGKDHEIIWPPMVMIMNTRLDQDENDKWIGMGNQELLDYFSEYAAVRSRHSYGPQGHRGMSVLIFENSPTGYFEAERLHKHFSDQRTDRNAWDGRRLLYHAGGHRQLYGFMATKEDLNIFNQHSHGKLKLKYEVGSYNELVVNPMRQMHEDNQQLVWWKDKAVKEKMHKKALQESYGVVTEKLRKTMEENRIVRQRTQMHNEQKKEEMDFQEKFFKDQLKIIYDKRDAKEEGFENLQQEKRDKVKKLDMDPTDSDEYRARAQEITKFIQIQDKEMEDFVAARDSLIKAHEDKMAEMKRRHWDEEVKLEKEFDSELDRLMEKYARSRADA